MKNILIIVTGIFFLTLAVIIYCDYQITKSAKGYLYDNSNLIPFRKVGLLLGTSKYLGQGRINEYFFNRIVATVSLYRAGKIKYIIISGDNRKASYNEPRTMKKELVRLGIPDSIIYPDYAGFRTFDSVIRASKVFGQNDFTVISQEFHNERAIFIAQRRNIHAIGFNAKDVGLYHGIKTNVREKFARVKVYLDLLLDKEPKYLGTPITIK